MKNLFNELRKAGYQSQDEISDILNGVQKLKKGNKIHIKESQKGSFTRYCGGNVTEECIRRGKSSSNPKIRKKATFAQNAKHWNHSKH